MVKHPTNFTQEEFDREQFQRRFYFAKFCAGQGRRVAPSGKPWSLIFQEKEGLTLQEFKGQVDEIKQRKK
mgnify:CR=1 FL=1